MAAGFRPATVRSSRELRAGAPGFRRPSWVCAKQSVAGPTCHRNRHGARLSLQTTEWTADVRARYDQDRWRATVGGEVFAVALASAKRFGV